MNYVNLRRAQLGSKQSIGQIAAALAGGYRIVYSVYSEDGAFPQLHLTNGEKDSQSSGIEGTNLVETSYTTCLRKLLLLARILHYQTFPIHFPSLALDYLINVQVKMNHSIYMFSIQIDTKSLELGQQHQIVPFCKPCEMEFFLMQFMGVVRLLDTLEQ